VEEVGDEGLGEFAVWGLGGGGVVFDVVVQDGGVEAGGSVELPGEGYDAVGEDGLEWGLGGEFFEELLAVEVEFGWVFAGDEGALGGEAVLEGVLGYRGLAFLGFGAG